MPTKYAKERLLRTAPRPPFSRQALPRQISPRVRLNLVICVICMMLFALQAVGPYNQQRPGNRSLGAAVVESKEQAATKNGVTEYRLYLRLMDGAENAKPLRAAVTERAWLRYATGDKLAVVYAPASGLAPARVFEIGAIPLEGAPGKPGLSQAE